MAGLGAVNFTEAASFGSVVKAVHITELRSALDAAMSALSLPTGGWTAVAPGSIIRAADSQQIQDRVK